MSEAIKQGMFHVEQKKWHSELHHRYVAKIHISPTLTEEAILANHR